MINEVKDTLRQIVGSASNLQHSKGAGRVFELYIMTGIGLALEARGYDVWVQRSDGTRVFPTDSNWHFIQRGGAPTGIRPASDGSCNSSSIVFQRGQQPALELLNGIQFRGRSNALHELDLAVVPESIVRSLRFSRSGGSPHGRPRVSIECKDVGTDGSVDEMRAFVARLYDLTILRSHLVHLGIGGHPYAIHPAVPPGPNHRAARTYRIENHRTLNVLARRTGFTRGVAALAGYHAIEPHSTIVLGSASSKQLMNEVADWISGRGY